MKVIAYNWAQAIIFFVFVAGYMRHLSSFSPYLLRDFSNTLSSSITHPADGHGDINQLLGKELGIMSEEKLEKISEYIEIKGGRIVLKHQRKISSLLVLRTLRSLTQGGTTK